MMCELCHYGVDLCDDHNPYLREQLGRKIERDLIVQWMRDNYMLESYISSIENGEHMSDEDRTDLVKAKVKR